MEKHNCGYAVLITIIMSIVIIVNILTNVKSIVLLTDIDKNMLRLH